MAECVPIYLAQTPNGQSGEKLYGGKKRFHILFTFALVSALSINLSSSIFKHKAL
jgi:hypothetical protein